jgi:uncharacterized protein YdaU (DUF1376 family)
VVPTEKGQKLLAEWFWVDRWDGSSAVTLPLEARGLYREMLSQSWRRGARLPNDLRAVRMLVRATAREWKRSWPLVEPYWRQTPDGFLVNDTQIEVYADASKRSDAAVTRGKRAAEKRWSNARAMLEHCPSNSLLTPSPSPKDQIPPTPLVEGAAEAEKPERKVGPQEQAARLLRTKTGGSLRVCRDQVASLIASGWTIERVTAAVHVHANAHVNPWEWKKKALAVVYAPGDHNAEARAFLARAGDGKRVAL